ncbi:hypothetical protein PIB30_037302 [Stylosanthes scabra]|uniref:Uncharacterized protein n=1 Tax=Stylosanthes scabra TaxID=79078 RepID=A0ABU6YE16_9FABA|nr:hypothetical protein [Stylosanthes scabra]
MLHFLIRRTLSLPPSKPHSLWNHPWHHVKFSSTATATATTCSGSKGNSFTVSYLIDTCGFSPQRALSVSKHLNFETNEKPELAFEFFKNHGLTQTQAVSIIRKSPQLLRANFVKSVQPKIDYFKSKGFSDPDIRRIMMCWPTILKSSLEKEIIPSFDFLGNILQSNQNLTKVILKYAGILCYFGKCLQPNIEVLREEGVPESHVVRFIQYFPRQFTSSSKKFKEAVQAVKELKFDPLKMQFLVVVQVKLGISRSTWLKREGIYRKWGWTDNEISAAFKSQPWCMAVSDNKIEAIMDFLVNKLGCTPSVISRSSLVLSVSLEKRIIPRGSVIEVLLSKGLVKMPKLYGIFIPNEAVFLDKFVYRHEKEAAELLKLYQAKLALAGFKASKKFMK